MIPFLARVQSLQFVNGTRWYSIVSCVNRGGEDVSFFADYLVQRFGFSKMWAISAAKLSKNPSLDHINTLVAFLNDQGLSDAQIARTFRACPQTLACDPTKLKPKIEFLRSFLEASEIAPVVSSCPTIMLQSLEKRLVPSFSYLRDVFESDKAASFAVRRFGNALSILPGTIVAQNLELLIEYGVPRSKLHILFWRRCSALNRSSVVLQETMELVRNMGFKPNTSHFLIALMFHTTERKQLWDKKMNLYKDCGWSEGEFLSAFRRDPYVAWHSEDKIKGVFDYLKGLGIKPSKIAIYPLILGMSLEKRLVPRGSIFKVLVSEGILTESVGLNSVFCSPNDDFFRKYVLPYDDSLGLTKLYRQKF